MFHIDFGFIFGKDPKAWVGTPPPMRIHKAMVEFMGGPEGKQYQRFKEFCGLAFNTLRKKANVIINSVALMLDASIAHIPPSRDTLFAIKEKFHLDLNEEEALKVLQNLLATSVGHVVSKVTDFAHTLVQNFF